VGAAEAARRLGRGTEVVLAIEDDDDAADVYGLNFPAAHLVRADVSDLFDGQLGASATTTERRQRREIGGVDLLVAGPPCQGHSDLNNHTRRNDPRNALYLRAVRAAEILKPAFVVLENVPAVQRDAGGVLEDAMEALGSAGYTVAASVLDLVRFGVPQRRRRHILLGSLGNLVEPSIVLAAAFPCSQHAPRTVAWAVRDLAKVTATIGLDAPGLPSADNRRRMNWLLKKDKYDLPNRLRPECHQGEHTYTSMYGRLRWDAPAQTITTGFGSMGQGRFVHPALARTITPHEAARLQTLPDFFDLDETKSRGAWATVIGNAVPPLLGVHIVEPLLCALVAADEPASRNAARIATNGRARRNGVPPASSEHIRLRMSSTKRRETGPELALRSVLHRLGYRYRVDRNIDGTRRRADIVFPKDRLAVFVDGCFWHGCPIHGTLPKQNHDWWLGKLNANKERDSNTDDRLRATGWAVLRFWEHDHPMAAAAHVEEVLLSRRRNGPG
jgi:DNA (cytosine-5)-methyltransferase 1